jgi:hypothetical protein
VHISKGLIIAIIGFIIYVAFLHSIYNMLIFKKIPKRIVMVLMMVFVAAYWLLVKFLFF